MSLIRQIWILLFATLFLSLVGSVSVHIDSSRASLQAQLSSKNSDDADSLALLLSHQKGDAQAMAQAMSALFDSGSYRRVRFIDASAKIRFEREGSATPWHAPRWFVEWVRLEATPGVAPVMDGTRDLGSVEVQRHAAFMHDELWIASQRSAVALALVGGLAAMFAALGVARLRAPIDAAVQQARALERGEYVTLSEPRTPELRRLTRAMNSMVVRLKQVFEAQSIQVETLRRQSNCDKLTELANRTHFLGQLTVALQRDDGAAYGGLVLLRVMDLAELNRSLGHTRTDQMLLAIAQVLQTYAQSGRGCLVGRLNGSDFALGLPVGGMSEETAQALAGALRAVLPAYGPVVRVVFGAVEISRGMSMAALMSAADMALARAEARGGFAVEAEGQVPSVAAGLGEAAWRQHIQAALADGRLQLGEVPVLAPGGRLIHIECPLRLQLEPEGAYEVAARWLPLAMRGRLTPLIDITACVNALREIGKDGRARCIGIATASLADIEFIPKLRAAVMESPRSAMQLSLTVGEGAAIDQFARVRELSRQLRPVGVRLGLGHAGNRLSQIDRLLDAGLDFVKLDSSVTMGVAADTSRAAFIGSVVAMLRGVSIDVYAEGVDDASDARALRELGIDAMAGAAAGAQTEVEAAQSA
jgi:predicted signal transduction protein with EAL and GGDEF domain